MVLDHGPYVMLRMMYVDRIPKRIGYRSLHGKSRASLFHVRLMGISGITLCVRAKEAKSVRPRWRVRTSQPGIMSYGKVWFGKELTNA